MLQRVKHGGFAGGYLPVDNPVLPKTDAWLQLSDAVYSRGVLRRRPGSTQLSGCLGDYVVRLRGVTLRQAHYLMAFLPGDVLYYDADADKWTSIRGSASIGGSQDDVWAVAEWSDRVYMSNGVDKVWYWDGIGSSTITDLNDTGPDAITVPPAKAIVAGYTDRVWIGNLEDAGGHRPQRIRWTQRNTDDKWSGYGSGMVELADDPYPITGMYVIAGRLVVLKGDTRGGSIVVGMPTGVYLAPVQFSTLNPSTGIGCPCPRTAVPIDANLLAFLGHDDLYLFDGASLKPIGGYVARHIIDNMPPSMWHRAFAYYDPVDNLYVLHVPDDTSQNVATRRYTLNLGTMTWTGPDTCQLTDAATYVFQAVQIWDTASGAWEDHDESWNDAAGEPSDPRTVVGRMSGDVWQLDDAEPSDADGGSIIPRLRSGELTFEGVEVRASSQRRRLNLLTATRTLTFDDVKTLRSVTVVYRDTGYWTPAVRVVVDGHDTHTLGSGVQIGSGTQKVHRHTWGCYLAGQSFQLELDADGAVELIDVEYEVDYAGKPQYA